MGTGMTATTTARPLSLRQLYERPRAWSQARRMQVVRQIDLAPTREQLFDLMRLRPSFSGIDFELARLDEPATHWWPDDNWQRLDDAARTWQTIRVGEIETLHAVDQPRGWVLIGRAPNLQFPCPPNSNVLFRAEFSTRGARSDGRFIISWRPPRRRRRS
jgi:hypothetical protein